MNCFQNCIFTYDSQPMSIISPDLRGCELLSELYFYLWFPTKRIISKELLLLWIAFRIVFLLMIPNFFTLVNAARVVVNCFQNCIFTYDSQQRVNKQKTARRCELLSELYFYLWFPTQMANYYNGKLLWIAFRIVFLLMIPNKKMWLDFF